MGFTSTFYFKNPQEKFDEEVIKKIRRVLHIFHNKQLIQLNKESTEAPVAEETKIKFNGKGDQGMDCFYLIPSVTNPHNFIKTGHWEAKPYTFIVYLVLILLKDFYKEQFIFDTDGFYITDIIDPDGYIILKAIKYLNKLFGMKLKLSDIKPNKKELVKGAVKELAGKFSMPA